MQTLDVFIQQALGRRSVAAANAWVTRHGFSRLYVRLTTHYIDREKYTPVLDIANLEARTPGNGAFTALLLHLRSKHPYLHIFVELVQTERFANYLIRSGFRKLDPQYGESYFLKATR